MTDDGRARLETMVRTTNGFEIAETDLLILRGRANSSVRGNPGNSLSCGESSARTRTAGACEKRGVLLVEEPAHKRNPARYAAVLPHSGSGAIIWQGSVKARALCVDPSGRDNHIAARYIGKESSPGSCAGVRSAILNCIVRRYVYRRGIRRMDRGISVGALTIPCSDSAAATVGRTAATLQGFFCAGSSPAERLFSRTLQQFAVAQRIRHMKASSGLPRTEEFARRNQQSVSQFESVRGAHHRFQRARPSSSCAPGHQDAM